MPNALLTGVSGLLAHQRLLEVVGHNIANTNTTGFKSQRALFADLMYESIKPATSAGSGNGARGGSNPMQIGQGAKIAQTDRKFAQGSLENTGEQFDLAFEGDGFFVVSDGITDFYTRAGFFSLDEQGVLVAPGGLHVQRIPGIGEPDGVNPSFQIPGDNRTRIPLGASVPGVPTSEITMTGNLSAELTGPLATTKTSLAPFATVSGNAVGTTLLNDLTSTGVPYQTGDVIDITGVDVDGTAISSSLNVDATTTVQDLLDAVDTSFAGVSATLVGGTMVLTADNVGPSDFDLRIADRLGINGQGDYVLQSIKETVVGKWADTSTSSVVVYDERGGSHDVDLLFTKTNDDSWRLTASMSPGDGAFSDNVIEEIRFNDDGSLVSTSDPQMLVTFNGIATPQVLQFNFSGGTETDQLTHFATGGTVRTAQDGSEPGTLVSVNFDSTGVVQGIASNGNVFVLAQLAVASFANPKGLLATGDSLYRRTLNSGAPDVGVAGAGDRGAIRGGALENSNVDLALEFTRLIVAQRGFSANARTITVSDEILEELTNIIR